MDDNETPPRRRLVRIVRMLRRAEHRTVARVALIGHLSYYGLVSLEAHGNYRYAAGVVGLILIFEALTGNNTED